MLILKRHVGQRIFIGKNVVLEVVKINGQLVSLGINAPKDVIIMREELLDDSDKKNKTSAQDS